MRPRRSLSAHRPARRQRPCGSVPVVLGVTVVVGLVLGSAPVANADERFAPVPPPGLQLAPPSPFEIGLRGFGMGLTAGIAGGYLVARDNGLTASDWRPIVIGAGIGALAGGALGFTLGIVDNNSAAPGRSYLVMRGMSYGGMFGLVAGGIIGGLAALETNKAEHILFGAAIGTLSGTALGLVLGATERNPWASGARGPAAWSLGVAPYRTAEGNVQLGPSVSGTF